MVSAPTAPPPCAGAQFTVTSCQVPRCSTPRTPTGTRACLCLHQVVATNVQTYAWSSARQALRELGLFTHTRKCVQFAKGSRTITGRSEALNEESIGGPGQS